MTVLDLVDVIKSRGNLATPADEENEESLLFFVPLSLFDGENIRESAAVAGGRDEPSVDEIDFAIVAVNGRLL